MKEIMRDQEDTPPSSINGDEVTDMNEEGVLFLDELEELQFDDEEMDEESGLELESGLQFDTDGLEPPEDHADKVLDKHVGSVFWCDLHPDGKLAVTGAEDDKAYVWSVETGQVIMDCMGHKDSVIFVGFSHDGAYLATADMSGLIKVWKCNMDLSEHHTWNVEFEYEADDITWGFWHFGTRVLFIGAASGDIYIFKIPSGETKVLQGHNVKSESAKLFPDGVRLAAGYADGAIKIWDLKTSSIVHHIPESVHDIAVNAIDTHPDNNLMASISADGKITLITSNNGKVVGQLQGSNDLESVAFSQDPQTGHLATATLGGVISIWDVTRQMIRNTCSNIEGDVGGVTKIIWVDNYLIAGWLDGSVRVYETRTGEIIRVLTGHRAEILDLCYNAKEKIILTTSDDTTARIFKYDVNQVND